MALIIYYIITVLPRTLFTSLSKNISQTDEKIILSEVISSECKIKITTTKRMFFLNTDYLSYQMACPQSLLNQFSPSGKFVVFQDISGGADSALKVYPIKYNDLISLDNFGSSTIFDIIFLPNDMLAILNGYQGSFNEQYLRIYDLDGLFYTYPANLDENYRNFTNLNEYTKIINLPDVGKDYRFLSVTNKTLQIHGTAGTQSEVLFQYSLN